MLFFIPVEALCMIRKREKGKTEERWQRGEHLRVNLETKHCRSCAKHLTGLIPNSYSKSPIFFFLPVFSVFEFNAKRALLCHNILFMIWWKRLSFEVK